MVRKGGVIVRALPSPTVPSVSDSDVREISSVDSQIVDNVVRQGRVADPEYNDESVEGVRKLLEHIKTDTNVDATTIGTVGEKGWDGFLYAVRL